MARSYFRRFGVLAAMALVLPACAAPNAVDRYDDLCPPPEFGRPGWVRVFAGVGAWVGAIGGGVVSIVLLPVTYPISLVASDGLGEHSSNEFLFFPALGGAAIGHCLLGTPPDIVDWAFRRVWVGVDDPTAHYDVIPQAGPVVPGKEAMVPLEKARAQ